MSDPIWSGLEAPDMPAPRVPWAKVFAVLSVVICAGLYGVQRIERGRQDFLAELDKRCVARPGERVVSENDGETLYCDRLPLMAKGIRWLR